MVLFLALFIWCIVGVVRASIDLRVRKRVMAELPAAAPARPAVAGAIRPEMARLDGYSDGLRQLVGMIGIVEDDPSLRQLRDEILSCRRRFRGPAASAGEGSDRTAEGQADGAAGGRRAAGRDGRTSCVGRSRTASPVTASWSRRPAKPLSRSRNLADRTALPGPRGVA